MPAGQYLATGFMYLNVGCHMMFVLKNRLKAQGISQDKTVKIIEDLVEAIFKAHLVKGVLTPQEPMTIVTMRDIFRKLAHSSIMKLDNASMEKLLFLIIMTLKKEFFLSSSPLELYAITKGNLKTLQDYVANTNAESTMKSAAEQFIALGDKMSFMEYHQMREYVLSAMEVYQTKVVNFAEVGLQTERGKLIFVRRNTHNHYPLLNTFPSFLPSNTDHLPLSEWKNWKTSLVIDHSKEYQRQSERRHSRNEAGKEKSLNDLFGLGGQALDYQVKLQLFNYGETQQKKPLVVNTKSEIKAKPQDKGPSKILEKIENEFKDVSESQEDEMNLLDMMDNS